MIQRYKALIYCIFVKSEDGSSAFGRFICNLLNLYDAETTNSVYIQKQQLALWICSKYLGVDIGSKLLFNSRVSKFCKNVIIACAFNNYCVQNPHTLGHLNQVLTMGFYCFFVMPPIFFYTKKGYSSDIWTIVQTVE